MSGTSGPLPLPSSAVVSVLRCISAAAPAIPFPGIAAAIEVVILIFDTAESVRTAKKDCLSLAEKAAQLVLSLHTEASNLESDSMTYEKIQRNIEPFRTILEDIQSYTSTLTKLAWIKQAWKRKEIAERVQELWRSLDECFQNFQIISFVRLQVLVAQFKDEHSINFNKLHQELSAFRDTAIKAAEDSTLRLTSEIQKVGSLISQVEAIQRSDTQKTYHLLKEIAVNVSKSHQHDNSENGWLITLRKLAPIRVYRPRTDNHAGITLATYKDDKVIVKRFHGGKEFVEERNRWKDIWHPYLPQIIGHSSASERAPFIVWRGDIATGDIKSFIQQSLDKNTVTGLLNGLEILYGASSALNYLRAEDVLTKSELFEIIQPCNIILSSHNRVLLGESLISRMASKQHVIECHRDASMDVFLSNEFFVVWRNLPKILVPKNRFTSLEVSSGQGPYSVLRLLLNFSGFGKQVKTMNKIAAKIEDAWLGLNKIQQNSGQVTFADIRQVFLSISDLPHARSHRLREDWDISTGDIGYVRHGKFVCLENILATSGFSANETEVLQVICDPPREFSKEIMSNGWTRYEFTSPLHVWFRQSERYDIGEAAALQQLITLAPRYLREHQELSLSLTDIILVTDTETIPRHWAEFFYRSFDDGDDNPPEKVYFFLKTSGSGTSDEAWGYWSIDPTWVEMPRSAVSNINDPHIICEIAEFPIMFEFVQLEKEDGENYL